jgi:hypothetical protein
VAVFGRERVLNALHLYDRSDDIIITRLGLVPKIKSIPKNGRKVQSLDALLIDETRVDDATVCCWIAYVGRAATRSCMRRTGTQCSMLNKLR